MSRNGSLLRLRGTSRLSPGSRVPEIVFEKSSTCKPQDLQLIWRWTFRGLVEIPKNNKIAHRRRALYPSKELYRCCLLSRQGAPPR
jgi:hypothetical protein